MKIILSLFFTFLFCVTLHAQEKNNPTVGKASYYAKRFHNKRTASGAPYKRDAYTCAHRDYPFGTKLIVRNPLNDKSVIVEVNDRGPHKKSRIIDVSYIAAKDLGILNHGITTVEVSEYIEQPDSVSILSDRILTPLDSIAPLETNVGELPQQKK